MSNAGALPVLLITKSSAVAAAKLDRKETVTKGLDDIDDSVFVSTASARVTCHKAIVARAVMKAASNWATATAFAGVRIHQVKVD